MCDSSSQINSPKNFGVRDVCLGRSDYFSHEQSQSQAESYNEPHCGGMDSLHDSSVTHLFLVSNIFRDEALDNETTVSMTNLGEILQKMNPGEGSVGKLINDDSLFKNAKLSLQKLEKATEGLEDQGPLSVLGIAVNSLF
jgi:hypothetical protein